MSYITTPQVQPQFIGAGDIAEAGNITTVLVASTVYLYLFEVQVPVSITKANWVMGATIGGTTNMGIYTLAGNLVSGSDTGAVTNVISSENIKTYATAINLAPGSYFIALAPSNSTDTYGAVNMGAHNIALTRCRQATNALAAGALPSTTGALLNAGTKAPACSLTLSGGI